MEICQCTYCNEAADKFNFFSVGVIYPFAPHTPVPPNARIVWKCIKANHQDLRLNKPVYIPEKELDKSEADNTLEAKWIPVSPGVISQKSVNETKKLYCPF